LDPAFFKGNTLMMTQRLLSCALSVALASCCLLALLPAGPAAADELPIRKSGLWEMKVVRVGTSTPDMTMQQCTDAATDREMSTAISPLSKEACAKKDIVKTATGYVSDSVCSVAGASITSHGEIVGDFNSAYTLKTTSHSEGAPIPAMNGDHATTVEAKWLGACKPDQKPGDIVMPGGMKINLHDMDKLKALFSKPK
jgi:hypothetical protein